MVHRIKIAHKDVKFLFPENIQEMSEGELNEEHLKRMRNVPGYLDNVHWPAGGTSHPDMWVAFPDVKTAVLYPPMVEYNFVKLLKRLDFDIIEATPEEYLQSGCNMVVLEPGKVITASGSDRVKQEMEKRGIEVIAVPYDEPAGGQGAGGAIDCTTCQLIRDPGPLVEELVEKSIGEIAPELVV